MRPGYLARPLSEQFVFPYYSSRVHNSIMTSTVDSPLFRVRLNCVDYYPSAPGRFDPPLFGNYNSVEYIKPPQVPVIRVFGSTESGQKACAHIHGAFPYLYVRYSGSLEHQQVRLYKAQLKASIDHALALSYRRSTNVACEQFVAYISMTKATPFFGYHVGYQCFLKIYLLNPAHMSRLADLLLQGAIMKQIIQPFESHAQYISQWMCDYNLYGCAYIECKSVKFRSPLPDVSEEPNIQHKWNNKSVSSELISDAEAFPRQSHCSIEVDIRVEDILNRLEIGTRHLHHDFMESLQTNESGEKLVNSLAGLWRDEAKRRRQRTRSKDHSSNPFPPEVLVSMSADPGSKHNRFWVHEEEYQSLIDELIMAEEAQFDPKDLSLERLLARDPRVEEVQTAIESVTEFYPERINDIEENSLMPCVLAETNNSVAEGSILVDEGNIPAYDNQDNANESQEEQEDFVISTPRKASQSTQHADRPFGTLQSVSTCQPSCTSEDESLMSIANEEGHQPEESRLEPKSNDEYAYSDGHSATPSDTSTFSSVQSSNEPRECGLGFEAHDNSSVTIMSPRSERATASCATQQDKILSNEVLPKNQANSNKPASDVELIYNVPWSNKENATITPSNRSEKKDRICHKRQGSETEKLYEQDNAINNATTSAQVMKPLSHDSSSSQGSFDLMDKPDMSYTGMCEKLAIKGHPGSFDVNRLLTSFCNELSLISNSFCVLQSTPPSRNGLESCLNRLQISSVIHQDAFYSKESGITGCLANCTGRGFGLNHGTHPSRPIFNRYAFSFSSRSDSSLINHESGKSKKILRARQHACRLRSWQYYQQPPSYRSVSEWIVQRNISVSKVQRRDVKPPPTPRPPPKHGAFTSQTNGSKQANSHRSKTTQKSHKDSRHKTQYMSTMCLEVHVNTTDDFVPNPERDEISCIFWCIGSDDALHVDEKSSACRAGILIVSQTEDFAKRLQKETAFEVVHENTELEIINSLIGILRSFDPDILTGYEVHNSSWGYLIERARIKYDYNLCEEFSRTKSQSHGKFGKDTDRWGFHHTSTIRITGRHMINLWRAVRGHLDLLQYSLENVTFHMLKRRIPHYSFRDLTSWYRSGNSKRMGQVIQYYSCRVHIEMEILQATELIPRTSEQARLIGVDFFSVFSRGSQFKVESFMFRLAKAENYILVSPSRKQVGQQNALECLPLVMEPQSAFFNGPLLVLDFQSLYPSIMIAYNYCYSTCLGRVANWRGQNKLGFLDFKRQPGLLGLVRDSINIAPNGIMYVKPRIRKSLLAKMLSEILETRIMIRSGMKIDKEDESLQHLLNNRQLALKLLANVTYGYTSASFSGRMPCSEIADSIVQTARETLERTIAFIHSQKNWDAEVVYGDTDSLFVYLKGRTKEQAFDIGNEIADEVTALNPKPMKLKFEKVYLPSVLLAKKRYVGFKYEFRDQQEPEFDAKGIETVRRDGTPAEQKIEETALKILFRTSDLSLVKEYFQSQSLKILQGRVNIKDFCFAREVKLGTYSDKGPLPPGALISTKRMLEDPRKEPQYGERVSYVVATGSPGARLIDRCVAPEQLLIDELGGLDSDYYILKNIIPPLERIFNLVGASARQWYEEMPKALRSQDARPFVASEEPIIFPHDNHINQIRKTLEGYLEFSHCAVCRTTLGRQSFVTDGMDPGYQHSLVTVPVCSICKSKIPLSMYTLRQRLCNMQKEVSKIERWCRCCARLSPGEDVKCDSKDCSIFYSRIGGRVKTRRLRDVIDVVSTFLEDDQCE